MQLKKNRADATSSQHLDSRSAPSLLQLVSLQKKNCGLYLYLHLSGTRARTRVLQISGFCSGWSNMTDTLLGGGQTCVAISVGAAG